MPLAFAETIDIAGGNPFRLVRFCTEISIGFPSSIGKFHRLMRRAAKRVAIGPQGAAPG
jgi:hypothetical protein